MMNCPKCGTENPEKAWTCIICGSELAGFNETMSGMQQRTSSLAVTSLILAILSFFTFCLTALPAIILSIIALVKISRSRGQLKGKSLAVTALCISLLAGPMLIIIFFIFWSMDAPPIPDDYTIADLQSTDPEYDYTYELLLSLSDKADDPNGAPAIGLNADEVESFEELYSSFSNKSQTERSKILAENADTVKSLWQSSKKGREVIQQLSFSEQIADLTEPSLYSNFDFLRNCKKLSQMYCSYSRLEGSTGNDMTAAEKLAEVDIVFRKLSINARSLITKLVCYVIILIDLDTANFLVNNPDTTEQTLEYLVDNFPPLTEQQVSLANCFKNEYLTFKNLLSGDSLPEEIEIDITIDSLAATKILKANSTLRLYRNTCDNYIRTYLGKIESEHKRFSVWPCGVNLPDVSLDSDYKLPWYYFIYNPAGSMTTMIMTPAMGKIFEIKTKVLVTDDLFQIVLAMRMGTEYSLKARAYTDEYIIDFERKIIYSPGPDGESFTDDDIKLEINPAVLGLIENEPGRDLELTESK
jgi:hypothetical protein